MERKQNAQCQILDMLYFLRKRKETSKEARSPEETLQDGPREAQPASGQVLLEACPWGPEHPWGQNPL